jgi:phosphohistidine phosphatase
MKKLLLVRHAKAVHDASYNDFERPLKHSGLEDAAMMAERVRNASIIPQLLVTSPSLRTLATAEIFSKHLAADKPREDNHIYDGGQQTLLKVINAFEDKYDFIGLVGHNPGINQLLYYFTRAMNEVPPGTVALVTFELDEWKLLNDNTGKLSWFSSPKGT